MEDTALAIAADERDADEVWRLLQGGADPNIPDPAGLLPIYYAVLNHDLRTFDLLMKAGADPSKKVGRRISPIDYVVEYYHGYLISGDSAAQQAKEIVRRLEKIDPRVSTLIKIYF